MPTLNIPFEKFTLDNGLTVILHRDVQSPLVTVDIWYHVGSKDEQPGRTGFAHLFEHLMFMGSQHAPYPSFDSIMENWGGHNNGSTSNDRTNYYETGPNNLLETILWLEADRLATLPVVITYEDLEAATVDDVRAFFDRVYRPSNASLVIAGDFEPAATRALVQKYFGWIPARPAPPRVTATTVPLPAERRETVKDRVQLPRLRVEWHSPAMFAPGDADLDLAAQILGGGKSSRLYKALVFEQRVAQDAWAYQSSQALGSLFGLGLTAMPGQTLESIEAAAMSIIERLATDGPTEDELERARNSHLADYYKGLDSLQTRADLLNHYEYALGDPDTMSA